MLESASLYIDGFAAGITIGAIGGVLGILLKHVLELRRDSRRVREQLVGGFLYQFQDSVESLWHRLSNIAHNGGLSVMEDQYFETSMLYALGKVFALEHLMGAEGIYLQLSELGRKHKEFAQFLQCRENQVSLQFSGLGFHHYDRLSLAELALSPEGRRSRTVPYLEFQRKYSDLSDSYVLKDASATIRSFSNKQFDPLLDKLRAISERISKITSSPSSILA